MKNGSLKAGDRMATDLVASITAWMVHVPLLEEWAASPELGGHLHGPPRLILCVRDEDGREGWGEGTTTLPYEEIREILGNLVRCRLSDLRLIMLDLWGAATPYFQRPLPPSPFAADPANFQHRLRHPLQAPVEMALLDLIARRAEIPLHTFFGGAWRARVPVDYWMGRTTPEHAARCVKRGLSLGFAGIKLKTTLEDENVARLEAICEAGGADWKVTVDPNDRFYRLDDALKTILAMDAVGNMSILEDPFPRFHLHEFAALRPRLKARVVLHIDPPESLHQVILAQAVGGLNLDSHVQGLLAWRMQAATAAQFNLPVWHGSGLDLGIATAAQLHLAAATPNCVLPGDQSGPWLRESSLVKTCFDVQCGTVRVPEGAGLGVEVDRDALECYIKASWDI